ncbi:MAG TPA: hypothetical protein DCQ64_20820 [Candidatus Rokubacteria bacterium]|nr:hypothetical protein [Candidatus Rokubacteria bacterium]
MASMCMGQPPSWSSAAFSWGARVWCSASRETTKSCARALISPLDKRIPCSASSVARMSSRWRWCRKRWTPTKVMTL